MSGLNGEWHGIRVGYGRITQNRSTAGVWRLGLIEAFGGGDLYAINRLSLRLTVDHTKTHLIPNIDTLLVRNSSRCPSGKERRRVPNRQRFVST